MFDSGDPIRQAELIRPDSVRVWNAKPIRERLSWYYDVMVGKVPAKFIIAKAVDVGVRPEEVIREHGGGRKALRELMRIHKRAKEEFRRVWREVREAGKPWGVIKGLRPENSLLDLKAALAKALADPCVLCERRCGARRSSGGVGACRVAGLRACVDTYFHHMGEEAPLVPSGTIFYIGCNFRCVYCQNWSISQPKEAVGSEGCLTAEDLANIQEWLRVAGARNINHVGGDPTPYIPVIVESLRYLRVSVPQLWNSNMYLSREAMDVIVDLIDIWLPDLKYGSDECAIKYSGVPNYVEVVRRNIVEASRNGDMIVRHLVLPNHLGCCTKTSIEWLAKEVPSAVLNIMDQYHPDYLVGVGGRFKELDRRVSCEEFEEALMFARRAGYEGPYEDLWVIPP